MQVFEEGGFDESEFEVIDQLKEKIKYERKANKALKAEAVKNAQLI